MADQTGNILITPSPGITATPRLSHDPVPGIDADIVDEQGNTVPVGGGYLVLRRPWPGMARTIWGDPERYDQPYWSRFAGWYFTGDGASG